MRMTFLGRDPAVAWSMIGSVLMALVALLLPFDVELQGVANAVILAFAGFATAVMVQRDAALPALLGLLKAVFALLLALGMHLPDTTQVAILALVSAVAAFFVRTQVVAPFDSNGVRRSQADVRAA
jgi:hypothetical protein